TGCGDMNAKSPALLPKLSLLAARKYPQAQVVRIKGSFFPDMHIIEAVRIALQSLWANKLRSVLTLLGVVIGVSSVIAVVTFVSGINGYVANRIFRLGADVFIISKA